MSLSHLCQLAQLYWFWKETKPFLMQLCGQLVSLYMYLPGPILPLRNADIDGVQWFLPAFGEAMIRHVRVRIKSGIHMKTHTQTQVHTYSQKLTYKTTNENEVLTLYVDPSNISHCVNVVQVDNPFSPIQCCISASLYSFHIAWKIPRYMYV